MIDCFDKEYAFLSNFYETKVHYNGLTFDSSEAAFQAQKCPERAHEFVGLSAKESKKLGRKVQMRTDWNEVRIQVMTEIVRTKFEQNSDIRQKLLDTYPEELIEGNYWHDTFWGVCEGIGENHLGQILMQIRREFAGWEVSREIQR